MVAKSSVRTSESSLTERLEKLRVSATLRSRGMPHPYLFQPLGQTRLRGPHTQFHYHCRSLRYTIMYCALFFSGNHAPKCQTLGDFYPSMPQQAAHGAVKVGHFRSPHFHGVQLTSNAILDPTILTKHVADDQ